MAGCFLFLMWCASVSIAEESREVLTNQNATPLSANLRAIQQLILLGQQTNELFRSPFRSGMIANLEVDETLRGTQYVELAVSNQVSKAISDNTRLFRSGEQDVAFNDLNNLLSKTTDKKLRGRLLRSLGRLSFKQREYEQAAQYFAEAREHEPKDVGLICNLAASYMSYSDFEKAEELLESVHVELIRNTSFFAAVHYNLACINSVYNKRNQALEHLSLAAAAFPYYTLANMGDTQLDTIRGERRFRVIQRQLEMIVYPRRLREKKLRASHDDAGAKMVELNNESYYDAKSISAEMSLRISAASTVGSSLIITPELDIPQDDAKAQQAE